MENNVNRTHPYYSEGAFNRLMNEYLKYDTLYIGFDFDNTIWNYDKYGNRYEDNPDAVHWGIVDILKKCKNAGFKLILWTSCPTVEDEIVKNDLCRTWGIGPHYINWSPLSPEASKPHFNLLLDDRAGLESTMCILDELFKRIENKQL